MKLAGLLLVLVLAGCRPDPPPPPPPDTTPPADTVTQPTPDPTPTPDPDPVPAPLSVSGLTLTMIGDSLHVSWNDRPNPDRGGAPVDGYIVRGGLNSSTDTLPQLTVASSPAGWTLDVHGSLWVCAYPFNSTGVPEQACGSVSHIAPQLTFDTQIEGCLAESQDQQLGIYYSPAADSCVQLGDVTDREDVNRVHAAYWRARGVTVNDDPFPGTVNDLAVDVP